MEYILKILVIGHALVLAENRKRWQLLAQKYPQLQVQIFIPAQWHSQWFGQKNIWRPSAEENGNYRVVPVEVTDEANWSQYRIRHLGSLLQQYDPQVIFVMQEEFTYCLLHSIICRWFFAPGAKLYFFSWQNIAVKVQGPLKRMAWWLVRHFTDGFLAGTEQIKKIFQAAGYRKPIFVQTELGVDPQVFASSMPLRLQMRQQLGLRDLAQEEFVFGFCGRLVPEKGVMDLVQALMSLSSPRPWKCLLVGDGPLREQIVEAFAQQKLCDQLIIIPEVPVTEVPSYMRVMDCLILPSRTTPQWQEQFGLVLAQAMTMGIPVVGSSSGAIPEVIGCSRCIFPEGDVPGLQYILQQIMQGEMEVDLSRAQKYSIDYLAQVTFEQIVSPLIKQTHG